MRRREPGCGYDTLRFVELVITITERHALRKLQCLSGTGTSRSTLQQRRRIAGLAQKGITKGAPLPYKLSPPQLAAADETARALRSVALSAVPRMHAMIIKIVIKLVSVGIVYYCYYWRG